MSLQGGGGGGVGGGGLGGVGETQTITAWHVIHKIGIVKVLLLFNHVFNNATLHLQTEIYTCCMCQVQSTCKIGME